MSLQLNRLELVNPEKTSGNHANTGALPTASARPDANGHLEKSAPSGKVDMELFQWPKFIISLSRKEKEDDFFAIKGCKLPIRPKKRLKHVEKTLHVSASVLILLHLVDVSLQMCFQYVLIFVILTLGCY